MSRIEISKKIVLINSASSAFALVLNFTVLIWLQQYLLKRISPEEYSLVPVLMSIMAFAPLATMALTQGVSRYITVAYAKGDDAEIGRICSTMFPILSLAGIGFLFFGWTGAWYIDKLIDIAPEKVADARIMMALLVFSAFLRVPLAVFGSGFILKQKFMLQDMIDVSCQLLRIAVLFSLLFGNSTRVLWVIIAMVVSEVVNVFVSTVVSLHLVPAQRVRWKDFHWRIANEVTSYGGWGFINRTGDAFKQAMDPLILNRFASAVDVSVFYVAGIAPRQLRLMLTPITRPFIPMLTAMYATSDFVRLRNTYLRTSRYHAWVLLMVAVPAITFSKEIMHLYLDGKYDEAGTVMAVLLVVTTLNAFNALGPAIAEAAGKMREISLRFVAAHITNLILTIFFVVFLQLGAFGSSIATLIAAVLLEVTVIWPFCRKIAHTPALLWMREVVLPCIITVIPSVALCLSVKLTIGIHTWPELILVSLFSAVLYIGFIAFFGLRQQDKIDISRVIDRAPGPTKFLLQYFAVK